MHLKNVDRIYLVLIEHLWEREAGKHVFKFTCTSGLVSPLCTLLRNELRQICLDGKTVLQHFPTFHSAFPSLSAPTPRHLLFCFSCHLVVPEKESHLAAWNENKTKQNFVIIIFLSFLILCISSDLPQHKESLFPPSTIKPSASTLRIPHVHCLLNESHRTKDNNSVFWGLQLPYIFSSSMPATSLPFPFPSPKFCFYLPNSLTLDS